MRRTTNLHWPIEPFGATQRPFAPDRPMMAAVTVDWTEHPRRPVRACVVYLCTDSTRTLLLDDHILNFGFEALTSEPTDSAAALTARLDEILVACRRHAKILAGHDLAGDLAALRPLGSGPRLPGIEEVLELWSDRQAKRRGAAKMVDTVHDLEHGTGRDLAATTAHPPFTVATAADPAEATTGALTRQIITRTLATALLAARATGTYYWAMALDLDQLVTDAAWDLLDTFKRSPDAVPLARTVLWQHDAPNSVSSIHSTVPKERA